jgi:ribosome-associated protein
MRDIDPAPVEAALARWASGAQQDNVRFAAIEHWRDELLRDEDALERFVLEHPAADRALLAALVRDARTERLRGAPPRRYRELFRHLKALLDQAGPANALPHPPLP